MTNTVRADRHNLTHSAAIGTALLLLLAGVQGTLAAPLTSAGATLEQYTLPTPPSAMPTGVGLGLTPDQETTIPTAITEGTTGLPGARVLTLDQIVSLSVNNNSNVQLARLRLQKAQELIVQVDAEARPQVSANLIDTYSSIDTFSTSGVTVASPALPGGGIIPTIIDQGGGSTGSFTGGGGGGTANSNGSSSTTAGGTTSTGSVGTNTGTGTGTIGSNNGAGTIGGSTGNGTLGGGTSTGTGSTGTGGAGAGNTGTGGGGTGTGSNGATAQALEAGLPPIAQQYATATQTGSASGQPPGTKTRSAQATAVDANGIPTGNVTRGQRNNYSGRLSVTQYIDLFGLLPAARDVEKITRDFYALDLDRVQNETALSAKDNFFNVLRDQETVNVDQEQVSYATENVRIATARYTNGTAAQFDVLTAQVTLANDQQALEAAQNQMNIDRANLNNLLGIDPNTDITLKAPPLPPLNQPLNLARSTQMAFAQRAELRQAENNVSIAEKLIKLAGATLQPTLGLGAGANYSGPGTSNGSHSTFNLSAQLNIPLYDGGTTHSRVRQAQVDLQTQFTTRDQLRENVTLEVRQAYLNVSTAQSQAATAGVGVRQAEEAVRLAQVRYQNGLGTFLDVINAQAQLATARNNLAAAQYSYQTSLAQLTRAEGGR